MDFDPLDEPSALGDFWQHGHFLEGDVNAAIANLATQALHSKMRREDEHEIEGDMDEQAVVANHDTSQSPSHLQSASTAEPSESLPGLSGNEFHEATTPEPQAQVSSAGIGEPAVPAGSYSPFSPLRALLSVTTDSTLMEQDGYHAGMDEMATAGHGAGEELNDSYAPAMSETGVDPQAILPQPLQLTPPRSASSISTKGQYGLEAGISGQDEPMVDAGLQQRFLEDRSNELQISAEDVPEPVRIESDILPRTAGFLPRKNDGRRGALIQTHATPRGPGRPRKSEAMAVPTPSGRKRGRPRKSETLGTTPKPAGTDSTPRKRGRPPKNPVPIALAELATSALQAVGEIVETPVAASTENRNPDEDGQPPQQDTSAAAPQDSEIKQADQLGSLATNEAAKSESTQEGVEATPVRRRGRPPRTPKAPLSTTDANIPTTKRKRGRPRKVPVSGEPVAKRTRTEGDAGSDSAADGSEYEGPAPTGPIAPDGVRSSLRPRRRPPASKETVESETQNENEETEQEGKTDNTLDGSPPAVLVVSDVVRRGRRPKSISIETPTTQ